MDLQKELQNLIKGDVKTDDIALQTYSTDTSLFKVVPKAVVFPKDTQDIIYAVDGRLQNI